MIFKNNYFFYTSFLYLVIYLNLTKQTKIKEILKRMKWKRIRPIIQHFTKRVKLITNQLQ